MGQWKLIKEEYPPQNKVLKTKIDDEKGERNKQDLILYDNLWWTPNMQMYVYYIPTHWWCSGCNKPKKNDISKHHTET